MKRSTNTKSFITLTITLIVLSVLAAGCSTGGISFPYKPIPADPGHKKIALLKFKDNGSGKVLEAFFLVVNFFGSGELNSEQFETAFRKRLAQGGYEIIDTSFVDTAGLTPLEIGRKVGADFILTGSYTGGGASILLYATQNSELNAKLYHVETGKLVWSGFAEASNSTIVPIFYCSAGDQARKLVDIISDDFLENENKVFSFVTPHEDLTEKQVRTTVTNNAPKISNVSTTGDVIPKLDFNPGKYYALVIGNNEYRYMENLENAKNDALAISTVLEKKYGFDVEILLNATRYDIITSLNRYRNKLTEDENLLIFYAGHGWLDPDADEGYWLPVDAKKDNTSNWLSNASITSALKTLSARHILVVADSCYSGKLTRGLKMQMEGPNYFEKISQKKSRTVMTSGGLEPVWDTGGKNSHSVFSSALLDVLTDNENISDAMNLFQMVRRKVMLNANQTPEYSDIRMAGHDGGDFLFVRQH